MVDSNDTDRLRAVAWRKGKETEIWLANLREIPTEAKLRGLPKGAATLAILDEESFADAARDPAFMDNGAGFKGTALTLPPFAVARLDIGG